MDAGGPDRTRQGGGGGHRFEQAPVALLLADPSGEVIAVNARWRRLAGLDAERASGMGWLDAVSPEERAMVTAAWSAAIGRGGSFRHRLGAAWVEVDIALIRDEDGRPVEHLAVFTDITTAHLAQVQLARVHDRRPPAADGDVAGRTTQSFTFLADHIPQLVVTADAGGVAEHLNRPFAAYTGLRLEEVRRLGLRAIFHPEDQATAIESWRAGLAAAQSLEHLSRVRRLDGAYRWFLVRATPQVDPTGRVVRWFMALTDIDDQKRGEELLAAERHRLFQVLTAAPALVTMRRGPGLELEWANDEARRAIPEPLLRRLHLAAEPDVRAQLGALQQVLAHGQRHIAFEEPLRLPWKSPGPPERFFNVLHEPIRGASGAVEGVFSFLSDVTPQVLARQRAEALAEDLRRAIRSRDDFLSIAGHELKTPLAALQLQVQGLQRQLRKGAELEPRRFAERLDKAVGNLGRLERLVDELLDVSRIAAGRITFTFEDVDLVALAAEVVDRFADDLARSGSSVIVDGAPQVVGRWDRLRVDQVMTNLVSNAVKYGGGRPIYLELEEASGWALLTVRDQGVGIAETDQNRIFGRFERAVSGRSAGGLGLGLWITRRFVEAMGGRVSFTSTLGQGSTFLVELPLGRQPA